MASNNHDELIELNRAIGRIEGTVKQNLAIMERIEKDSKETARDNRKRFREADKRMGALEKKLYAVCVIATAVWGGALIYFRKIFS